MKFNYTQLATAWLNDMTALEEKVSLAKHWAGLRRTRHYMKVKSVMRIMGLRPSSVDDYRRAMALVSDLEDAGVGLYHSASPVIDGKSFDNHDACFLFHKGLNLVYLAKEVLILVGESTLKVVA